jgi:hypothetical protein
MTIDSDEERGGCVVASASTVWRPITDLMMADFGYWHIAVAPAAARRVRLLR